MIAFIKGVVCAYDEDTIVVEQRGIGYEIRYPHTDRIHLNEEVKIHTFMHVTENDLSLFGFDSKQEKELFLRLISVKGLGPKTGMGMLSSSSHDQLVQAIETNDVSYLIKLPGIGKKTASQIILDLKGKLVSHTDLETVQTNQEILDAKEALKNLGYKQKEVDIAASNAMDPNEHLSTEQYLKKGLQYLLVNSK